MESTCSRCQSELQKEARFCSKCGLPVGETERVILFQQAAISGDVVANKIILSNGESHIFYEPYHWKEALSTGISLFLGLWLIINSFLYNGTAWIKAGNVFGGLLIIGLCVASFQVTDGWKRANDLPTGKKILAYFPVLTTGVVFIGILVLLMMIKEAIVQQTKK